MMNPFRSEPNHYELKNIEEFLKHRKSNNFKTNIFVDPEIPIFGRFDAVYITLNEVLCRPKKLDNSARDGIVKRLQNFESLPVYGEDYLRILSHKVQNAQLYSNAQLYDIEPEPFRKKCNNCCYNNN